MMEQVLSEEERALAYTQGKRKALVEQLLPDSSKPSDPKDTQLALQALSDMDRVSLGKMRLHIEEKAIHDNAAQRDLIAKVLDAGGNRIRQRFKEGDVLDAEDIAAQRPVPSLGTEVPPPVLVEGETSVGSSVESLDQFMTRAQQAAAGQ